MDLTPALILAVWTAGIAGGAAAVAWWQVVGPGYGWLSGAVAVGFGALVAVAGGGTAAVIGVAAAAVATVLARRREAATMLFVVSTVAFVVAAWGESPLVPVLTGALFVGGITSEMLLGHWYLVDPRLPRWALQRLALAGALGLLAEAGLVLGGVIAGGVDAEAVFGWAYLALVALTGLLIVAVWFSLREPRYSGVMAATGLSYLAVLTAVGVLVVGRMVAFG